MYKPLVSIIIPTYNEEEDIRKCLRAIGRLHYKNIDVVVVDDGSTDKTVEVVKGFESKFPLKLKRHSWNRGVAAARNTGIKSSEGEIIIILNADVLLPEDFIDRILPHYEQGADFVVCDSKVLNDSAVIPAYLQALHELIYRGRIDLVWSEGFSCKKRIIAEVGYFDEQFIGASGEDAAIGFKLDKLFKRVLDKSIKVPHIAPSDFRGFVKQRIGRGRGSAFFMKHYLKKSVKKQLVTAMGAIIAITLLLCVYPLIIFPTFLAFTVLFLRRGYKLSKTKPKYHKFFLSFSVLSAIDFVCSKIGFIKGLLSRVVYFWFRAVRYSSIF